MSNAYCSSKPKIITICGSMRFADEMLRIQSLLTLEGRIVLMRGIFSHVESVLVGGRKRQLDLLHKRKIEMSDEIFVVNPGGYLDESAFSEIMYAVSLGVKVSSCVDLDDCVGISDHDAYMATGKRNLARFVDGLIQEREPTWFKNHLLRNRAEALCYQNREAIEASSLCGCFSCGAIFKPEELIDTGNPHWDVDADGNSEAVLGGWVDEGKTAVCPYCHVDQIIGDAMGFEITEDLLNTIASCEFVYGLEPL